MRALASLLTTILILLLIVLAADAQSPYPPTVTGTPTWIPTVAFSPATPAFLATYQVQTREPQLPEADVPLFVIPAMDVPVVIIRPLQQLSQVICFVIQSLNG